MDWIPAYLDLWVDDKADLSHATRSIFLRLCLAARRARRDGLVPLSPSAPSNEGAIHVIVGGRLPETKTALVELLAHKMVAVEPTEEGRALRILSWTPDWVLDMDRHDATEPDQGAARQSRAGRPRKWASEADRSRARRTGATGNPTGNDNRSRPETKPVATGNETGLSPVAVGGKGGASPPDQKRVEERKVEKKTEEVRSARAGARQEEDDPEPTPETIDGKLLAALRASPGIVRYEQEGTLRLADCAATLAGEVASYEMGRGLPIEAGLERAFAALADVEKKVTAAALTSEPWPPARVAEKLRTFTQGNLGKSREAWEADQRRASGERPSEPGSVSDDARVALEVFAEVWAAKKRRAFVQAVGDEKHAAALVEAARPVAAQLKIAGRDVVRFWAEKYLGDPERFVADAEHPLRLLPSRLTTYGAPPAKKKPTAAFGPSEPAKTPEAPAVLPPPDWREKLAAVGTAGNAMTRRTS